MMNEIYVSIEPFQTITKGNPYAATFGKNHRLIVHEETDDCVVVGYDMTYYGESRSVDRGALRFPVDKKVFLESCITMREFNLRWLESIRGTK